MKSFILPVYIFTIVALFVALVIAALNEEYAIAYPVCIWIGYLVASLNDLI